MAVNFNEIKEIIKDVLDQDSSFTFEMKVLKELSDMKFKTEHSGVYTDPYTKQNREFDIRAWLLQTDNWHIDLSVECKNISPEVPLIIHSTPIPLSERTHSLIINHSNISSYSARKKFRSSGDFTRPLMPITQGMNAYEYSFNYIARHTVKSGGNVFPTLYSDFAFVGRSMDKLKSKSKGQGQEKTYYFDDSDIYQKFSQAQNSLVDLIEDAYCQEFEESIHQFLVLPIVVLPDGTLWEQKYSPDGSKVGDPELVERVPFYVNKTYIKELHQNTPNFTIRFVEIVTFSGLKKLMAKILNQDHGFKNLVFLSDDDLDQAVLEETEK